MGAPANLDVHTVFVFACFFAISFRCLFILNEGFEIREIPYCKYVVILQEGEIHLVPIDPTRLFSKNHIGVTVYLRNSLLLGISSHGYVKGILWVLGYNNFYANIGLTLRNNKIMQTIKHFN